LSGFEKGEKFSQKKSSEESETADKNRNTFAIIAIDTRFVPVKQFRCIDVSRSGAKENILRLKAKKLQ
jgi:hypothetical protein